MLGLLVYVLIVIALINGGLPAAIGMVVIVVMFWICVILLSAAYELGQEIARDLGLDQWIARRKVAKAKRK